MLVLSRRLNEAIYIDGDIRVTVVGIRGNQVRLGIEAPGHVKVFREELCAPRSADVESTVAPVGRAFGDENAPAPALGAPVGERQAPPSPGRRSAPHRVRLASTRPIPH